MRRLIRGALVLVVLMVVLFYAAGGWYFSGQIDSGALRVGVEPVVADLTVASVGKHTIGLADPGPQNVSLRSTLTYGVSWRGGYGRVTGAPDVEGDVVTRKWALVTGTSPAPGTKVSMDTAAYPLETPGTRTVHYRSPRGLMPATYFPGKGETWAILVHGKGATRADMYRLAQITHDLGMPTLSIGYRNDPGAPRDPSRRYGYGVSEWHDLQSAIGWARGRGASDVVLGGASMGGAIIASYMQHSSGAAQVEALILDAPMLDLRDTIALGASQRSLPGGLPIPGSLTWTAEELAAMRYDVDWGSVDYTKNADWVRCPTLVFHGTSDDTVPLSTSRLLARESSQVELVEVPGAEHVESWNLDPAAYTKHVDDFLAAALK